MFIEVFTWVKSYGSFPCHRRHLHRRADPVTPRAAIA
jgi:hypothetical protein